MLSEKKDSELYINPWQDAQSPAVYLSHVEELPTASLDEEKSIEEKIEKMEVSKKLNDEQQKEAKDLIKKEKGIFARNVEELGRTERTNHVINTSDAAPIKQNALLSNLDDVQRQRLQKKSEFYTYQTRIIYKHDRRKKSHLLHPPDSKLEKKCGCTKLPQNTLKAINLDQTDIEIPNNGEIR
ncbi:7539_t:CDS:2 [Dentiscutata erythropus]|uniref:7539_t:CDS:1 n=1 Tax=Dentiscutata erythropus TaxID=1348616 RepID=A0A9N9H6M5_9GLOM|nr:7539_t:CDS:2 [Dentiscutata erythropus]